MRVALCYRQFLDYEGKDFRVGGVETYMRNLASVCKALGFVPVVFQFATHGFEREVDGFQVIGVRVMHLEPARRPSVFAQYVLGTIGASRDIVVFMSESQWDPTRDGKRCIVIQHGIYDDIPHDYSPRRFLRSIPGAARVLGSSHVRALRRGPETYKYFDRLNRAHNRVCVDYNFTNCSRMLLGSEHAGRTWIIPNFAAVLDECDLVARWAGGACRVLFARRFEAYRGTRIMASAVKRLLQMHSNLEVTFAGEGPEEAWLQDVFGREKRVTITRYHPSMSADVHREHQVAVVPSLGSEGTSLSVAEAMGAGCAVVASAVGGITNMVIDNLNGLLVQPTVPSVTMALDRLLRNASLGIRLGDMARRTIKDSFSVEAWRQKWSEVLLAVGQM